jgi:transcriptional regulator with XRE-family HTH domain
MTNICRLLGDNVRRLRTAKGYSQEKLAEIVGKTTKHLNSIENGRNFASAELITAIAAALGVDTPELFSPKGAELTPIQNVSIQHFYQAVLGEFESIVEKHIGELQ